MIKQQTNNKSSLKPKSTEVPTLAIKNLSTVTHYYCYCKAAILNQSQGTLRNTLNTRGTILRR